MRVKSNIYFADFETLTKNSKDYELLKHTDVYLWYVKNKSGTFDKLGYSLDTFMDWVMTSESKIIYFHNLSFDGNFIFKWLLRKMPGFFVQPLDKNKDTNKSYYKIFKNGNKIYNIKLHLRKWDKEDKKIKTCTVIFKCSLNILTSSIDSLGKCFNLKKLSGMEKLIELGIIKNKQEFYDIGGFNMPEVVKNIFIDYIKQDVEIARLAMLEFEKHLDNLKVNYSNKFSKNAIFLNKELTIGSICYKLSLNYLWQKFGKETVKKYRIQGEDYDLAYNFFYGGWTQFNPAYWNKTLKKLNGICIDINSSYPNQMCKLLPIGRLYEAFNPEWIYFLTYVKVDIKYAKIKDRYKDFVILKNWKKVSIERYVRELNNFTCYYTLDEFNFIKKIYDIKINDIKYYYSEAKLLLKDFINELYKYKCDYSMKKEKANALTYKIMLNSLYGKQCTRKEFTEDLYVPCEEIAYFKDLKQRQIPLDIFGNKYVIDSISNKIIPYINAVVVRVYQIKSDKLWYNNILIGAQITSYARLQLWETILKVGVDAYMYSDTDSIFFNTTKDLSKLVDFDNYKLGAWSEECRFVSGKIIGAKRYSFVKENNEGIKFGFSGVNNIDYQTINWDDVISGDILINAQTYREEDDYGILIGLRDYKINKGSL